MNVPQTSPRIDQPEIGFEMNHAFKESVFKGQTILQPKAPTGVQKPKTHHFYTGSFKSQRLRAVRESTDPPGVK